MKSKKVNPGILKLLSFTEVYDEGQCEVYSEFPEFLAYMLPRYRIDSELLTCRLKIGIHHWSVIPKLQAISEQNSVIELVRRDKNNRCFELYAFSYEDRYLLKLDAVLKEIAQFDRRKERLEKQVFSISGYHKEEVLQYDFNLTSKEFSCLLLYASGCSHKQIADTLNLSTKTIDYHIAKIKEKTNLRTRKAAHAYLRANNWQDLVGFLR